MITTVTGKNQVTIPSRLARKLKIQPGTRLYWSIDDQGQLVAQPLPSRGELARRVAGMGRPWLPEGADPVGELIRERSESDSEEDLP
jgi:AbrB family looped-hinge helix DNA binding protein